MSKAHTVFLFCGAGDETRDFVHDLQAFYHWAALLVPALEPFLNSAKGVIKDGWKSES